MAEQSTALCIEYWPCHLFTCIFNLIQPNEKGGLPSWQSSLPHCARRAGRVICSLASLTSSSQMKKGAAFMAEQSTALCTEYSPCHLFTCIFNLIQPNEKGGLPSWQSSLPHCAQSTGRVICLLASLTSSSQMKKGLPSWQSSLPHCA